MYRAQIAPRSINNPRCLKQTNQDNRLASSKIRSGDSAANSMKTGIELSFKRTTMANRPAPICQRLECSTKSINNARKTPVVRMINILPNSSMSYFKSNPFY